MALREVTLLRLKEDGTFLVWAVSRGKNIPEEFRTVEKAIFRSLSTVKRNEAAVKFPSKHVTYLVEREPGVWSRGSVENVFQSSKGCLADVFFVDYGTKATLPHTRFLPMPSELEDYRHLAQHYILDGIEPVISKQSKLVSTWGSTVMSRIRKLSKESSLLLKTVPNTTSNESGVQGAVLYTLDMRTNINELLVSEGLAQRRGHAAVARTSVSPTCAIERTDHFSTSQDVLQESLQSTEVSGVEYDPTIMVFSPRPLPPIYDLSQLGLPRVLEQKLAQKLSLSSIATHSWPFLLKEENLLGVCPPTGDYRMSYLLPLVSLQLKNRTFHSTTKGQIVDGPPIVVFLPNSHEVDKVSEMCQQLMEKCLPHERLTIVKCYGGIEAEVSLQLLNGCDLLLVTPSSLLRLVNSQRTTLHNLHHLVFDEANTIVDSFSEEIKVIIRKYVDAVKGSGRLHNLQVVAVTTECTPDVLSLMEAYGKHGREGYHMIVTCAIEAMVIGKPKLKVEQADFSKKLDCLTQHLQATTTSLASIVFVSSDQEQQEVVTFLQTYNYPVVKIANSQDLTHYKELLSSVQCIVLHDRVLPLDPSVLPLCSQVHYSLPSKVQVFRHRLSVAMKAFKTKQSDVEIMIFIDGSTTVNQMTSVTKLLKRMNQPVPDFLNPSQLSPADKWNSSQGYDLCYYFCAFGECKVGSRRPCRNLHSLSQLSTATNSGPPFYPTPSDGVIKFKACHVGNGSRLWIRILEHHPLRRGESPYIPPLSHDILKLHSEISKYFSIKENCVPLTRPKPGDCCVFITSEGTFHRAQIYDFDREINDFYHHKERAKIRLLDIGASEVVELNQLFQLPHRFTTQTRQVVECYVCNTKPNDQDKDFSIMALSFVKDKYEGKDLWGCILATHPGYLWLGTVEKREYLTGVGVFTSLSNWRKELLRQKMALDNPEHLNRIVFKCEEEKRTIDEAQLGIGGPYEVFIPHVDNVNKFYVQLLSSSDELDDIYESLNKESLAAGVFSKVKMEKGELVAAIFPEDKSWYRGKISDYNPGTHEYRVFFVDYGEEEWVEETAVQHISPDLLQLPAQAVLCSLEGTANLHLTLAESYGKQLEQLAVENNFVAKVLFVENSEKGKPCHYVELYTADGDNVLDMLQSESNGDLEGVSLAALPHLSSSELGALGSVFQSSPSSSSLTAVHLDVVKSKGDFKLEEAELEWVVSRLCHIPPELLEQVMNIITSLIYCDHHSVSVLTSPLSTEIFHNILKQCSTEVAVRLSVILKHIHFDKATGPLLTEGWIKTLCRVFTTVRNTQAQQSVLHLLNAIITEDPSLVHALILEGGVSTISAALTVCTDPLLQPPLLTLLRTVITSEEGDVCLSSSLAKSLSASMETAGDVHAVLLALHVASVMANKGNPHLANFVKKSIERLIQSNKSAFVKSLAHIVLSKIPIPVVQPATETISSSKPKENYNLESKQVSAELHPMVLWGQTRDHIELKLELFECKDVRVDVTTDGTGLHFRGLSRGQVYTLNIVFYKEIASEHVVKKISPHCVVLRIDKRHKSVHWTRLTKESSKVPYIRADFDLYSESNSDDDDNDQFNDRKSNHVSKINPSQLKRARPDFKEEEPLDSSLSSKDSDDQWSDLDDYL